MANVSGENRILLIAASIGSGHMKAAEAIADEIRRVNPGAFVEVVDFTMWQVSWATAFMKSCYLFMLKFIPNLYELMYRFTGGKSGGLSVQSLVSMITSHDIKNLTRKYEPNLVICTHPFPAGAASWRKGNHPDEFGLATVITDYSVHQMWIYHHVDAYFVARASMKMDLVAAGIPNETIFVTGIPIGRKFSVAIDPDRVRDEFGLDADRPCVLIMGGGLGLGGVDMALKEMAKIERSLDVIVVTGKNEKLYSRATTLANEMSGHHHVVVFGFTDRVREIMGVSSFVITKPGALTISEAMAARLPMLLHEPIPGPETQNAVYAAREGVAIWVNDSEKFTSAIYELLTDDDRIKIMRKRAMRIGRPSAAREIVETLAEKM